MKSLSLALAAAACLALAGCNSSAPPPQAQVAPQQTRSNITPPGFKLPEGSGCAAEIARYRAVMNNDRETGNVNDTVYRQIDGEIAGAEAACASGNAAQASALIRASKTRHGYPG